ncbi:MAG TPA: thiazole biosynthesis protein [Deltaproteobacteria bacterium]|nr:thiazole biosynthesis protein [Deltaproteobacteria bacterium]
MLNEVTISQAIITTYMNKLMDVLELDVAIAGAGPSGLVAGYYLAHAGKKVALFDKKLSIGGGIWGGGMMFNEIVVQDEGKEVLDELGIPAKPFKKGYYTLDSVDAAASLVYTSIRAGLKIFNLINVEDIVYKADRVGGLVINWSTVEMTGLHVDPLTLHSSFVLDATGHPANITQALVRKMGVKLDTPTGSIMGERSMDANLGERHTVENTREVYPGLFVSGMAANAVYGGYRMGAVFGGMFLSGKKAAHEIISKLS